MRYFLYNLRTYIVNVDLDYSTYITIVNQDIRSLNHLTGNDSAIGWLDLSTNPIYGHEREDVRKRLDFKSTKPSYTETCLVGILNICLVCENSYFSQDNYCGTIIYIRPCLILFGPVYRWNEVVGVTGTDLISNHRKDFLQQITHLSSGTSPGVM